MTSSELHALILSLPETEAYDHGGLPAFRVRGRRFASMLDDDGINLMPGEPGIRAAAAMWPGACSERWFAKRLAAVRVAYPRLARETVVELVEEAWASKAPKRVVTAYAERRGIAGDDA